MVPDLRDTIVALSSAPGSGARAIVRISGPMAFEVAGKFFQGSSGGSSLSTQHSALSAQLPALNTDARPNKRCRREGQLHLPGLDSPVPADVYFRLGPQTYTGQDLAEVHTLSSPPLVDHLVTCLLGAGARSAQPGEFTLRAFLAGKIDLTRAEAVLGVIEAGNRNELQAALVQLAGGVTRPLQGLREDLLDLLAEVEAGLDFAEEDIRFVAEEDLLKRLAKGLAQLTNLKKQLEKRGISGRSFRVVLAGRPNTGKSTLFNALTGDCTAALVSPQPGTTRDYLIRRLEFDSARLEIIDTAGWQNVDAPIEEQAQELARQQAEQADLLLLCIEAGQPISAVENRMLAESGKVLGVATKCDLAEPPSNLLATSGLKGTGIEELRRRLGEQARNHGGSPLAPSLSRCQHHVEAALQHLRQAHRQVLFRDPPELLALELRGALEQLGEMVGAVYTDDLLDRIFSRFCIGK
jgi:tRNA modification GTPase